MAIDAKKISVCVGRFMMESIRAWFRSLLDHPFAWFMVFFALFLYRFFPSLFAFLVSSAPVLVCTAVLLGTLLSLGQPNIPQFEEEETTTQTISTLKSTGLADNHVVESDARISVRRKELEKGIEEVERSPRKNIVIEEREPEEERLIEVGSRTVEQHDDVPCIAEQSKEPDAHLEGKIDFSQLSSWKEIDGHHESDSDSDGSESSSPDASMTDIMPMLDELHPLLDLDAPQPAPSCPKDSDEDSEESTDGDESHDDSEALDEEEKIQEEEEEEVQDDQEEGASRIVTWTEDDERNLKDIKTLELERNLKMENLIAKRIATKNQKAMTERNLIDLDGFSVQIPSVSTARRNPFDLPYSSDENPDLPPIPGSAPSVLLPRINPFDQPCDQPNSSDIIMEESSSRQDSVTHQQRETLFCRHESFTLGTSFIGEIKHETGRLKPFFVVDMAVSEQTGISSLQRQMSENTDSKVSSVNGTDTNSSIHDQEQKEILHDESQLEVESSSTTVKIVEQVSRSDSSEEPLYVEDEQDEMDVDAVDMILNGMEDEVDIDQSEVVDENCGGRLSSSSDFSSEDSDKSAIESKKAEPSSKWSTESVQSSMAEADRAEETLAVGPVYDTSPSAIEKSISNMTAIEKALFYSDKADFNATSVLSDSNAVMPDRSLTLAPGKNDESVEDGREKIEAGSSNEGFWAVSLNLEMVNEHELQSREVAEFREEDAPQVGLSEIQQDDVNFAATVDSAPEPTSSVADLPLQDMEDDGPIPQADLNAQLYEPDTKIWATKMEIVENEFNSVSSIGSAEGTELLSNKNDEAEGIKEFDEHFLAELDAIGDFNVERDGHANQADVRLYSSGDSCKDDVLGNVEPVKVNSVDREVYLSKLSKQEECNTDFEHPESGSQERQSMEGVGEKSQLDATGDFVVIEESQATRGDDSVNLTIVASSKEGVQNVGSDEFDLVDEEVSADLKEYNRELEVLEARSLEDIDSVFVHSQGDTEKSINLEAVNDKSTLLVCDPESQLVDAACTEEISSAINQPTEEVGNTSFSLQLTNPKFEMEEYGVESAKLDPVECEASTTRSPDVMYSSIDLEVLDAISGQDIDSVCVQTKGESEKSVFHEAVDGNSAVVVTIPELEVTDAAPIEDIGSSLQQPVDNDAVTSLKLELDKKKPEMAEAGGGSDKFNLTGYEVKPTGSPILEENGNELELLEARFMENIDTSFMQMRVEAERSVTFESVEKSMVVDTDTELELVDSTSIEDISSTINRISERDAGTSLGLELANTKSAAEESGCGFAERDEKHVEHINNDIRGSRVDEITSGESGILKIDSSTEKSNDNKLKKEMTKTGSGTLGLEDYVVPQTGNSNAEILHEGIKEIADDSGAKIKTRSSTSDSSSSSSSSSSDSD